MVKFFYDYSFFHINIKLNFIFKNLVLRLLNCFFVFSLFFFSNTLIVLAQDTSFKIPELKSPVVDQAQILTDLTEQKLNKLLQDVQSSGGSQIQVLTLESLQGLTIEEASLKVVTTWALGSSKKDNGVLLLIAVNDRQMRIEVGQGLEGDLTDANSVRIINQIITPYFKSEDFDQGVLQGVLGILKYTDPKFGIEGLKTDDEQTLNQRNPNETEIPFWLRLLIIIIFLIIIFNSNSGSGRRGGFFDPSGGGGFGNGGGWSGGGGGFSGGGASGRW